MLFCPTKVSRSWQAIEASGKFCVNVLHEKQKDVSARFGSKEPDKFAGIDWSAFKTRFTGNRRHAGPRRLPRWRSVHDGGDHFVVFGAVHSLSEDSAGGERSREEHRHHKKPRPLLFYRGEYTGIEPDKNSPAQWRDDLEAFLHHHHCRHLALSHRPGPSPVRSSFTSTVSSPGQAPVRMVRWVRASVVIGSGTVCGRAYSPLSTEAAGAPLSHGV